MKSFISIFYYTGTVYLSQSHDPETGLQPQSCSNLISEHPVCGRGILFDRGTGDTRDEDEILSGSSGSFLFSLDLDISNRYFASLWQAIRGAFKYGV